MTLLTIDQEKCKRDGICADVCPAGIIEFKGKGAFPAMIDGGDALCIQCGHCVAVCPHMALKHTSMPPEMCPPIRAEWLLTAEQAEQFLRARRSTRVYKKNPVARDLLSELIHVARFAPSGHNLQPAEWLVIHDTDELIRLAGMVIDWMRQLIRDHSPLVEMMHLDRVVKSWESGSERIFRGAPHVVIAHSHQDNRTAQSGCTIALTYLELMAPALGLGACWAGYFTAAALFWPPVAQALKLPEGHVVFGAMMVGYPKYTYHRLPLRKAPNITWR